LNQYDAPCPIQAPALPGAQSVSDCDRVYTADQDSNTVTVINPNTNMVLGTIVFGNVRMDTDADILGAMYKGEINVHGLGFSRDGRYLAVICVTTNSVHVVETTTNKIIRTIYVDRAPHEGFFSPDGCFLWVAERGLNTVAIIDWRHGRVVDRIVTEDGPSKVVFSPDGGLAYVNHLRVEVLDVIDVLTHRVIERIRLPSSVGGSSDEAISPDGREIWLGMPVNGRTTSVLNTKTYQIEAIMDTGPRTNHPNFVTVDGVDYAYLTVGDLNQTLVYRRDSDGRPPILVKTIQHHGAGPHGIWPSPDNTRIYVALQYSDAVDVIDTKTMTVIETLRVGQSPMALVYVARNGPGSLLNMSRQGLGMRIETVSIDVQESTGWGTAQIRALPGLDEVVIDVRGLPPNRAFTAYAVCGGNITALLTATSNSMGAIPEALAFVHFFANRYDRIILSPALYLNH
jgi:YVTN family beta-propeller protein